MRFNENKLLIDPYTKALTGKFVNRDNLLLSYKPDAPDKDMTMDTRDNSGIVPKCIVIDESFDWQDDAPPDIQLEKLYIYEVHLKGFTAHPSSKVKYPGTYLGFIEKIPYLKELGINVVELLPVHEFYVEDFLRQKNLTNYWGYNTIGFFTPESSYSTGRYQGCQVDEFKTLVRELHKAGIEVFLDVVYNHTAEGNELGPTMSFRGIDNPTYYCLIGSGQHEQRYYINWTGCGNCLDLSKPPVIRLVLDSLRYWVEVMHVDGFRFDLASCLGRENGNFYKSASFFDAVSQDPVLSRIKLIAEPWDISTYQVGNFPVDWSEWNGKFRDNIRRFGKGDGGQIRELGWRITGSTDLYGDDGRSAYNSINFVTCHDGFTLYDLVSYNTKHNEANLEDNRDGTDSNDSWNCGAEGETDDPAINRLRRQLIKNYFCYLITSSGTPMILGGDEFLRTQKGNNNAYCQDNEISWFNWEYAEKNRDILEFVKRLIKLTRKLSVLQRRKFFIGKDSDKDEDVYPDITWFGFNLDRPEWDNWELRTLCGMIDAEELTEGRADYLLFFIMNGDFKSHKVLIPQISDGKRWHRKIDTSLGEGDDLLDEDDMVPLIPPDFYYANPRSFVLLVAK